MIFFGYKVEDSPKYISQGGFTGGISAHNDVDLFVTEVRVLLQMFVLNIGVHNLFWIGQVHLKIFKGIKIIQIYI